jgi:hypothetical protein
MRLDQGITGVDTIIAGDGEGKLEEEDLFDNGIDGEPCLHQYDLDATAENDYDSGRVVYHDNGVEFTACPVDTNYVIITDKYWIYWYLGSGTVVFYPRTGAEPLLEFKKEFDLGFFATMHHNGSIAYSSADRVNRQVERYLNMKAFL